MMPILSSGSSRGVGRRRPIFRSRSLDDGGTSSTADASSNSKVNAGTGNNRKDKKCSSTVAAVVALGVEPPCGDRKQDEDAEEGFSSFAVRKEFYARA